MNRTEFEQRFIKLTSRFGHKTYHADVVAMIFNEVKNLTSQDFDRLVMHFMGSSRFAPLVNDFRKAITDLGLKSRLQIVETVSNNTDARDDILYHLRDNIWANNNYIFIRGIKSSFIIKEDNPNNPLVIEDRNTRAEKIKEAKEAVRTNSYGKYTQSKIAGLRTPDFSEFSPKEPA